MLDLLEKAFNLGHTFAVNTAGKYMKKLLCIQHPNIYSTIVNFKMHSIQATSFGGQFLTGQSSRALQSPLTFSTRSPLSSFDLGLEPLIVN